MGLTASLLCTPSHALWFDEIRDPESLQIFCRLKAREFEVLANETDRQSQREQTLLKIAGMWNDLPDFYADPERPVKYAEAKLKQGQETTKSETINTETPQVSTTASTTQIPPSPSAIPVGKPLDLLDDYLKELSELESTVYPLDSLNFLLAKTVTDYYNIQTEKYNLLAEITAKRATLLAKKDHALTQDAQTLTEKEKTSAEEAGALAEINKILAEKRRIIAEQSRCTFASEKYALIAQVWQKIKEAKLALFDEGKRPLSSLFRSLWLRPDRNDPYHHGDALESSMTGSMIGSQIGFMASSQSYGLIHPFPLITFASQAVWEEYTFTGISLRGFSNQPLNTHHVFNSLNEARFHYGQVILERLKDMIHKMKRVKITDYEQRPQSPFPDRMTLSYQRETEEDSLDNQIATAGLHVAALSNEMNNLFTSVQQQSEDESRFNGLFSMIGQLFSSKPSVPKPPKGYTPWFNYKAKVDYLRHRMNLSPAMVDKILEEGLL